ncbi:hemerythrin domain-containing protein [Ferrovum myxofaciens]|jgi:hemerythrin|uniref:hypothetical protein n=1 Tax=Ferrovum myxofaciens TaxID=416213 RepID=UPI00068FD50E|nr:hypothetical protein [Ferrovum myxofaciens]
MYIHWDKSYEIGNPLIDTEHRLLIMLFRKLDVAIKSAEPEATIMRILLEVKKFADFARFSEHRPIGEFTYPEYI